MKKLIILKLLILLTFFNGVYAAEEKPKLVSFDLQDVGLLDFAQASMRGLLNTDFVIEPNLHDEKRNITLQIKDKTPDAALKIVLETLRAYDIELVNRDGVNYLTRASSDVQKSSSVLTTANTTIEPAFQFNASNNFVNTNQSVFIYQPQYRNFTNVQKLFSGLNITVNYDDNLLVLIGEASNLDLAKQILSVFDKPNTDLLLKVSVVEYLDTESTGFNVFTALDKKGFKFSVGSNALFNNSLKVLDSSFTFILSALNDDTKFNVINTSHLRVVNGKVGRLNIGNEVPILSQYSQTQAGQPVQNVEYRNSGLIVDISPVLIGDYVQADLKQQLSSFVETTTSTINSPTLTKRELTTNFTAKLNEVVIIGGLENSSQNKNKTSLFGITLGKAQKASNSSLFIVLEFSKV